MATANRTPTRSENGLLARLPADLYRRLRPHLTRVRFDPEQVLHQARKPAKYAYFPDSGVLSAVTVMETGEAIEVGTVGREGMVSSIAFLGVRSSPHKVFVQLPGNGLRAETAWVAEQAAGDGPFRRMLVQYHTFFLFQLSQSLACNGLHTISQRCARWLLMTHDRVVQADEFRMTHAYLSKMLAVRRASVSEVLNGLQQAKLVRYRRGTVAVLDRQRLEAAACPCYQAVRNEYTRLIG